jgi:hypothetical protein
MGPGGSGGLQNRTDPPLAGGVGSIPTRSRHTALARWGSAVTAAIAASAIATGIGLFPSPAAAQQRDSARAGVPPATSDTAVAPPKPAPSSQQPAPGSALRPPISPGTAFLDSFILPGYGQSRLGSPYTGALFFTVEAVAVLRVRQAQIDLKYAQRHLNDSTLVVQTYEQDPTTGQPLRDSLGRFIPATYAYSKYDSALVSARKTHLEDWWAVIIFNHLISGADAFVEAQLWDLPAHVHPIAKETADGRRLWGASVSF